MGYPYGKNKSIEGIASAPGNIRPENIVQEISRAEEAWLA
jgi:hypothetical protein